MEQGDVARRVGAGLAGCLLLPLALGCLGAAAASTWYAVQAPDAFDRRRELCCDTPDTWGRTLMLAVFAAVMIALAAFLCVRVFSLALKVVFDEGLPRRTLARAPRVALALYLVALPVGWIVDSPRLPADCKTFTLRRADWRATDGARWRAAEALVRCGTLRGQPAEAVRRRLGPPDRRDPSSWVYVNAADAEADRRDLRVVFHDGRVSATRFSY
jgi:hypothetical protein